MFECASSLLEWIRTHAPTFAPYYDDIDTPFNNYVEQCVKEMCMGLQQGSCDACLKGRDAALRLRKTAQSFEDEVYATRCYEVYVWMCRQLAFHLLAGR